MYEHSLGFLGISLRPSDFLLPIDCSCLFVSPVLSPVHEHTHTQHVCTHSTCAHACTHTVGVSSVSIIGAWGSLTDGQVHL